MKISANCDATSAAGSWSEPMRGSDNSAACWCVMSICSPLTMPSSTSPASGLLSGGIFETRSSHYVGRRLVGPPDGKDRPYFPIFEAPKACSGYLDRLSHYKIPACAFDEIKAVQPYGGGYQPLWLLYLSENADKHRLPIVVLPHVQAVTIFVRHNTPQERGAFPADTLPPSGNIDDSVDVDAQASVYISWVEKFMPPEPVERTLENIVKCVADIVPRFDRFFP